MTTRKKRWLRPLSALVLSGCLCLGTPVSSNVWAQAPEAGAEGEGESGRYLDGYLAFLVLAALALFVVGKTARR